MEIVNFIEKIPNGVTTPVKIEDEFGKLHVMKFIHDNCSGKILYNELIAYRLGKLFEVPMPECNIGRLSQETIDSNSYLQETGAIPCHCFLSSYKNGTANIAKPMLKIIKNQDDIACILVFDQIILNEDRSKNPGNLYLDKKTKRILAIDHSHIFKNGEIWTSHELNELSDASPVIIKNLIGKNYKLFSDSLNGYNCFHSIKERIKKTSEEQVINIFDEIPNDWEITEAEIKSSQNFILRQIEHIDGIIEMLQDAYSRRRRGQG